MSQNESYYLTITIVHSEVKPESVVVNVSHKGQSTTRQYHTSHDESEPSALGAQWVRKSQSDSGGYSAFSFSSARRRYIYLPKAFDQSAQLVLGAGGDTTPPLGRCSIINTKSMSILTVSSDNIDGGGDCGGKGHAVLQML
jgi:hypothetical protein